MMRTAGLVQVVLVVAVLSLCLGASAQWSITWGDWVDDGTTGANGYWSAGLAGSSAEVEAPGVLATDVSFGGAMGYWDVTEWCPGAAQDLTTDIDASGSLRWHEQSANAGTFGYAMTETEEHATVAAGNTEGWVWYCHSDYQDTSVFGQGTDVENDQELWDLQGWHRFGSTGKVKLFLHARSWAKALYTGCANVETCYADSWRFFCDYGQ